MISPSTRTRRARPFDIVRQKCGMLLGRDVYNPSENLLGITLPGWVTREAPATCAGACPLARPTARSPKNSGGQSPFWGVQPKETGQLNPNNRESNCRQRKNHL
jgi:hypothetical protein